MQNSPKSTSLHSQCPLLPSDIQMSSTIIFSDMTGTLLRQTVDGSRFPGQIRQDIVKFIEAGGVFVVVTGDSLAVAQEQFLRFIPESEGKVLLILHSGAEICRFENEVCKELYKAPPIPEPERIETFEIFCGGIFQVFGVDISSELESKSHGSPSIYAKSGPRIELESLTKVIGGKFFVEASPFKVTVYCEEGEVSGSKTDRLFQMLSTDTRLVEIASRTGAHLMRGAVYFELISHSKEQGIRMFCERYLPKEMDPDKKLQNVIVLGDSPNDEGMFLYDYGQHFGAPRTFGFFMGNEEIFMNNMTSNVSMPSNFTYLKGEHESGTARVLKSLLG